MAFYLLKYSRTLGPKLTLKCCFFQGHGWEIEVPARSRTNSNDDRAGQSIGRRLGFGKRPLGRICGELQGAGEDLTRGCVTDYCVRVICGLLHKEIPWQSYAREVASILERTVGRSIQNLSCLWLRCNRYFYEETLQIGIPSVQQKPTQSRHLPLSRHFLVVNLAVVKCHFYLPDSCSKGHFFEVFKLTSGHLRSNVSLMKPRCDKS